MPDKRFVDTNVLMYAHDRTTGAKHRRARELVEELWNDRSGAISTQVLQELCVNLRKKATRPLDPKTTREIVTDYLSWDVVVNTGDSVLRALDIEVRYGIGFWDALVLEAAESAGAQVVYSEDLSDGQLYGTVRVVNPFKGMDAPTPARI